MAVWAIADLHLALSLPEKSMEAFGEPWIGYVEKIQDNWVNNIQEEDLVLIAGDISWAMKIPEAKKDLDWIDNLPGKKVLIKGNHDYWWSSLKQVEENLPLSIHVIQNQAFVWKNIAIGGARLWDSIEYNFQNSIDYKENPKSKAITDKDNNMAESEKIFTRELSRLEQSLKQIPQEAEYKIAMTHYPPIGCELQSSRASNILEKYKINICVFGHLHNIKKGCCQFGRHNGIQYSLTSCDFLEFKPLRLL